MKMPRVICIIVTFNREHLLQQTLDAVLNQTFPLQNIIVIDNNSFDNTRSLVSKLSENNPKIEYHNTGANIGGAGGFHRGFAIASKYKYDYLWLMDDDLKPEIECLYNLISSATEHGIYQPIRINVDGSCAELSPVVYDLKNPFFMNPKRLSVINLYKRMNNAVYSPFDIHGVPFEGPLISRDVIQCIGYPNPNFFIFYDALDYSLRARKAGFEIKCIPSARAVRLLKNNQRSDLTSWKGYFMFRNLFYIHRTYGENIFVRLKPFLLVLGYLVFLIFRFKFNQVPTILSAFKDSRKLDNSELHKP